MRSLAGARGSRLRGDGAPFAPAALLLLMLAAAPAGTPQDPPVVRTPRGSDYTSSRVRAVTTDEGSGLALFDRSGGLRALLGATLHGPGVAVFDPQGQARSWAGFRRGGLALRFWNARGVLRTEIRLSPIVSGLAAYRSVGPPRSAAVIAGAMSGAAYFGSLGQLRVATVLGEYLPVMARFDEQGTIVREPLYHLIPGLVADAVKTSARFMLRWTHRGDPSADIEGMTQEPP